MMHRQQCSAMLLATALLSSAASAASQVTSRAIFDIPPQCVTDCVQAAGCRVFDVDCVCEEAASDGLLSSVIVCMWRRCPSSTTFDDWLDLQKPVCMMNLEPIPNSAVQSASAALRSLTASSSTARTQTTTTSPTSSARTTTTSSTTATPSAARSTTSPVSSSTTTATSSISTSTRRTTQPALGPSSSSISTSPVPTAITVTVTPSQAGDPAATSTTEAADPRQTESGPFNNRYSAAGRHGASSLCALVACMGAVLLVGW